MRPTSVLLRWINTLVSPARSARDVHLVFANGLTLCLLLQKLRPSTHLVRFPRALTRGTALSNLEEALALIWQLGPHVRSMPSAQQILDGSPRELLLRFIDELYSLFVVRPARARLPPALRFVQAQLVPYGRALSLAALQSPHTSLVSDLRTGASLACVLHACLPPRRSTELAGAYWQPLTEEERRLSLGSVFAILLRERLAPCKGSEFAAASATDAPAESGKPDLATDLSAVIVCALHARFGSSPPLAPPPPLRLRDDSRPRAHCSALGAASSSRGLPSGASCSAAGASGLPASPAWWRAEPAAATPRAVRTIEHDAGGGDDDGPWNSHQTAVAAMEAAVRTARAARGISSGVGGEAAGAPAEEVADWPGPRAWGEESLGAERVTPSLAPTAAAADVLARVDATPPHPSGAEGRDSAFAHSAPGGAHQLAAAAAVGVGGGSGGSRSASLPGSRGGSRGTARASRLLPRRHPATAGASPPRHRRRRQRRRRCEAAAAHHGGGASGHRVSAVAPRCASPGACCPAVPPTRNYVPSARMLLRRSSRAAWSSRRNSSSGAARQPTGCPTRRSHCPSRHCVGRQAGQPLRPRCRCRKCSPSRRPARPSRCW